MSVQLSTGFRAALMGAQSFEDILQDAVIRCYSGAQPANADAAVTGTLLGSITRDGGPFTPGSPTNGLRFLRTSIYGLKRTDQQWRFTGVATGTLGWARICANAVDDGSASAIAIRIDGRIGLDSDTGDIQFKFANLSVTPSSSIEVPGFIFALPPLPSA